MIVEISGMNYLYGKYPILLDFWANVRYLSDAERKEDYKGDKYDLKISEN